MGLAHTSKAKIPKAQSIPIFQHRFIIFLLYPFSECCLTTTFLFPQIYPRGILSCQSIDLIRSPEEGTEPLFCGLGYNKITAVCQFKKMLAGSSLTTVKVACLSRKFAKTGESDGVENEKRAEWRWRFIALWLWKLNQA